MIVSGLVVPFKSPKVPRVCFQENMDPAPSQFNIWRNLPKGNAKAKAKATDRSMGVHNPTMVEINALEADLHLTEAQLLDLSPMGPRQNIRKRPMEVPDERPTTRLRPMSPYPHCGELNSKTIAPMDDEQKSISSHSSDATLKTNNLSKGKRAKSQGKCPQGFREKSSILITWKWNPPPLKQNMVNFQDLDSWRGLSRFFPVKTWHLLLALAF